MFSGNKNRFANGFFKLYSDLRGLKTDFPGITEQKTDFLSDKKGLKTNLPFLTNSKTDFSAT